jgi:hypothetical protein
MQCVQMRQKDATARRRRRSAARRAGAIILRQIEMREQVRGLVVVVDPNQSAAA